MSHPINKMFHDFVNLKDEKVSPDAFPTYEDYLSHCHSIEREIDAIRKELYSNGYTVCLIEIGGGFHRYELQLRND